MAAPHHVMAGVLRKRNVGPVADASFSENDYLDTAEQEEVVAKLEKDVASSARLPTVGAAGLALWLALIFAANAMMAEASGAASAASLRRRIGDVAAAGALAAAGAGMPLAHGARKALHRAALGASLLPVLLRLYASLCTQELDEIDRWRPFLVCLVPLAITGFCIYVSQSFQVLQSHVGSLRASMYDFHKA